MRRALVVANWKMNKTVAQALAFVARLAERTLARGPEVVLAPPATALHALRGPLAELGASLCAQGGFAADAGAYTGALSAPLLQEAGARYLLVGHNERRTMFGESPEVTGELTLAATRAGLCPIVCVGEDLATREAGQHLRAVRAQLAAALAPLAAAKAVTKTGAQKAAQTAARPNAHSEAHADLVVAYEPVWAIGAGRGAQVAEVAEVHRALRRALAQHFGADAAEQVRLLYGGSVAPDNVAALAGCPNVDGVLVGKASLDADTFAALVAELARAV